MEAHGQQTQRQDNGHGRQVAMTGDTPISCKPINDSDPTRRLRHTARPLRKMLGTSLHRMSAQDPADHTGNDAHQTGDQPGGVPLQGNLGADDGEKCEANGVRNQEQAGGNIKRLGHKKTEQAGDQCGNQIGLIDHPENVPV